MKIYLAGYNVDVDELNEIAGNKDLSPETFSAAYARISRSPKPVNELRKEACSDVGKARKSNERIVFEMGHSSVAEHAVFNFDVLNLSRLAVEDLENFRLCSYTEKSQRYITLDGDYVVPEEIKKDKEIFDLFNKTIEIQNKAYENLFGKLKEYFFEKHKHEIKDKRDENLFECFAKEDARYILSLATECQLGMTINCRILEVMLRRFASSNLLEVNEMGKCFYDKVKDIVPSLIRYHEKNKFESETYKEIGSLFIGERKLDPPDKPWDDKNIPYNNNSVSLLDYTSNIDEKILTALLHSTTNKSYEDIYNSIASLSEQDKKEYFKKVFQYMNFYDKVLREFEYANFTFELTISASCFAQLKRHRMATFTKQLYDPALGVTVPDSIKEANLEKDFMQIINLTNDVYLKIKKRYNEEIAQYILTNSHKRRVLFSVNVRELYHISRLREDIHAQWDIRNISGCMVKLAKEKAPLALMMVGGKHNFKEKAQGILNKNF